MAPSASHPSAWAFDAFEPEQNGRKHGFFLGQDAALQRIVHGEIFAVRNPERVELFAGGNAVNGVQRTRIGEGEVQCRWRRRMSSLSEVSISLSSEPARMREGAGRRAGFVRRRTVTPAKREESQSDGERSGDRLLTRMAQYRYCGACYR